MNIKLTAVAVRHLYGRNMVVCVPRNAETNEQLEPENGLAQVLDKYKNHTIINAEEVLTCVVTQFGFGA